MRLFSKVGALSAENWQKLQGLQLEPGDYYPAAVSLNDGKTEPCVMFIEKDSKARQSQFRRRGFFRDYYSFDDFVMIDVSSVVGVSQSPFRTPPEILRRIHRQMPTPAYGILFTLKDGTEFLSMSGDFIEFCSVPPGYTTDDIVDFKPLEEDLYKDAHPRVEAPPFKWCIFSKPT